MRFKNSPLLEGPEDGGQSMEIRDRPTGIPFWECCIEKELGTKLGGGNLAYAKFFEAVAEGIAADAEQFGCLALVAAGQFEGGFDVFFFHGG